jgi:hypothetical protein
MSGFVKKKKPKKKEYKHKDRKKTEFFRIEERNYRQN